MSQNGQILVPSALLDQQIQFVEVSSMLAKRAIDGRKAGRPPPARQDARALAQGYAAQLGIAPAFINGNVIGPYPVNKEGLSLEHVRDEHGHPLPANHARMQPARYRVDVPVCRPLR